jgi:hypothetical protein
MLSRREHLPCGGRSIAGNCYNSRFPRTWRDEHESEGGRTFGEAVRTRHASRLIVPSLKNAGPLSLEAAAREVFDGNRRDVPKRLGEGQWLEVSGQWSVVSGQWSVVGGQRSQVGGQRPALFEDP